MTAGESAEPDEAALAAFWDVAKHRAKLTSVPGYLGATPLAAVQPPAWAFGATPEQADELLALVLAGRKTATAGALWDYQASGEPVPSLGTLDIVLDGRGRPRALITTTAVSVVPFEAVDAEHARLEGEGDRTLAYWRSVHRRFFTDFALHDRGFSVDMPVVLQRFRVLYGDRT